MYTAIASQEVEVGLGVGLTLVPPSLTRPFIPHGELQVLLPAAAMVLTFRLLSRRHLEVGDVLFGYYD